MDEVASLPSFDDLSRHVKGRLCLHDQLDPEQTPLTQSVVMRSGRPCGLFFQIQGPRRVKSRISHRKCCLSHHRCRSSEV